MFWNKMAALLQHYSQWAQKVFILEPQQWYLGGEIYVKFYVQGLSKHKALHMIHIVEAVHV